MFKRLCILLIGLITMQPGFAMRCHQSLVYEGDTKYQVERKCGEPLAKEIVEEPIILYNPWGEPYSGGTNTFEVWTYQQSPSDFIYQLYFRDGVVNTISANRS